MHRLHNALWIVWCGIRRIFFQLRFPHKVVIGNGTLFRKGLFINPASTKSRISIGRSCFFNNYCSINSLDSVTIGDKCSFGEGVKIYDHDHDFRGLRQKGEDPYITACVTIGDGVWCGSNVVILKGVSIGSNSVVGAGTVVARDIPPNTLVYARQNLEFHPIGTE